MKHLEQVLGYRGAIKGGTSIPTVAGEALKTKTHYWAGYLNQLTNGKVIESKNDQIVGTRSVSGNKLPAGISFLVIGIRLLFDTTASVQANGIGTAVWASVAPANFKNGEISIIQGAELLSLSGTDATNFKASTSNDDDFKKVVPFMLRPETAFDINITLANGTTAAVDQAYKIELVGVEFIDLDKA